MLSKSFETLLVRKVSFAEECQLTEILYCTFGWALASPGKCQHFSKLLQKRAGSAKVLTKKHGTNLPVLLVFAKGGLTYVPTTSIIRRDSPPLRRSAAVAIAELVPAFLPTTAVPAAAFAPPAGPPRTAPLRSDVAGGENAELAEPSPSCSPTASSASRASSPVDVEPILFSSGGARTAEDFDPLGFTEVSPRTRPACRCGGTAVPPGPDPLAPAAEGGGRAGAPARQSLSPPPQRWAPMRPSPAGARGLLREGRGRKIPPRGGGGWVVGTGPRGGAGRPRTPRGPHRAGPPGPGARGPLREGPDPPGAGGGPRGCPGTDPSAEQGGEGIARWSGFLVFCVF